MALRREFKPALLAAAPLAGALLVMAAGAMLIASGATPSSPERFMRLSLALPSPVIEISHFASSVLGLVLVMLAFGLKARLDADGLNPFGHESTTEPERFSWEGSDCEADASASRGVSEARAGARPVTSEGRGICRSRSSKHDRPN